MSRFFGEIRQNGYVVEDIHAAMTHWTKVLGVGPFFYMEEAPIQGFRYRGEESDARMSIALANSGPLQIELIQVLDDEPSMYRDFLAAGHLGLQHVAYWTTEFDRELARAISAGTPIGQEGQAGGPDGRFVYFDTEAHPGTVVELSEISGPKGRFFERIAEISAGWDGSEPIRTVGGSR